MRKIAFVLFGMFTFLPLFAGPAKDVKSSGMSSLMAQGGNTLGVLITLSVLFIALALFLLFTLRKEVLAPMNFLQNAEHVAAGHDIEALTELCKNHKSPAANIIGAAAEELSLSPDASYSAVRDAVEDEGARQAGALWQRIQYIMDIAVVAPMIGLLGTVLGMRQAFAGLSVDIGSANPMGLADGVGKALITTAGGLILGIAAMLVHSYFRGRVNDLISELENRCGKVLRVFVSKN